MGQINGVWARIVAHQGEAFWTKTGIAFIYSVSGDVLRVDRANQNLPKSTFAAALRMWPVPGPGAFNNVVRDG